MIKKIMVSMKSKTTKFMLFAIVITISHIFAIISVQCSPTQLFSQNVEALSDVEQGQYIRCFRLIKYDPGDTVFYCGTCSELPGRFRGGMDYCKQ